MKPEIPYILRVSAKAKRVRLLVTLETGLEIVVPTWFRASRVPAIVEKNSHWIERAFQKAKAFQGASRPTTIWQIPEEISLPAIDRKWSVVCCRDDKRTVVVVHETSTATLSLQGVTEDAAACQTALKSWLTQMGKDHLIPWLKQVSERTGLSYSSVSIRQQKTRWGSCSPRGSISINARLLFLPPELVTYVLVHELCHTRELNHSHKFWRLVELYLPDYRQLERHLRHCGRSVQGCLAAPASRSSKN
jgi:predicted metal-dependent hydrolase